MRLRYVVAAIGVLGACRGGTSLPAPGVIEVVPASNQQSAPAGSRLAAPLAALARSDAGVAVPRARVRWRITTGTGAVLSDSVTVTDGNGRAEAGLTLGPAEGTYEVTASLVDATDLSVVFTATATPAPTLTSVAPTTFTGGDTITLTGTGLAATARVEVAGHAARVLTGSNTTITAVAPVCLAPGPVQVRARIALAYTPAQTATFTAATAALQLAPGEYASIDPAQLAGCATIAAAGAQGAQYLVAPQSVSGVPGVTADFRLAGDSATVALTAPARASGTVPFATRFHDALRAQEREAARRPRAVPSAPPVGRLVEVNRVDVGDRRAFQVCSDLPCSVAGDFQEVNAEARYVGAHAALFLDTNAPTGFTDADFQSLGELFDENLYDVDTRAFGAESDADQNGVVIILFSPVVNGLTPEAQCSTSIITGYFFGVDIDPFFADDPRSNGGEVFYALAPDASGTVTCELSTATVRRLVPVTFVHEFQHMISYNQHVLIRAGASEVLWLNEALSHIAEELAGRRFELQGNDELFSQFAVGDLFNAYMYLERPGDFFVLPQAGTGSLEERGAAWLFVRWLLDQYGEDATRRLVETSQVGAANVETVFGDPFERLLAQWFLANFVSDLDNFNAPDELTFTSWRLRTTYGSLNQQLPSRFTRPFPIEPMIVDGSTLDFTGVLHAGSGDYLLVEQGPNDGAFTLALTAPGGGVLAGNTVPRLNIIRIR